MIFESYKQTAMPLLEKIMMLPFNQELANGTLPMEKFIFYLQQDSLYLTYFSKALAITAIRLPGNELMRRFLTFSLGALTAEQTLHHSYIQQYAKETGAPITPSPACSMYTDFLMHVTATQPIEEAVASLIPCFWVYHEVGTHIIKTKRLSANHPYQSWIDLYSGTEFGVSASLAIETLNELMADITSKRLIEKTQKTFLHSTKLEWLFWDSAYRMEKWRI